MQMENSLDYSPFASHNLNMYRRQIEQIIKDLNKKIVFIVGPRQVGKTWLAKEAGKQFENTTYLNYDHYDDKEIIKTQTWLNSTELLILDELHKMPEWKNYLKGLFDKRFDHLKILVTGSARLDTFRQGGDSLAGRFFTHRLMPFSLSELKENKMGQFVERFIERGGFPEPFLAEDKVDAQRWRNQYIDGLIREDILNFEKIQDLSAIKTVFELLRRSVGSPVSYASIARDVNISPTTVLKYVTILESLYIVFKITPFSKNIARSILKAPKLYFFDTGLVLGDEGAKFENHVALSLLKHVYASNDYLGEKYALNFLRTKEGKEVDFCLSKDSIIEQAIEVKNKKASLSKNLVYFCNKYNFKGLQIVKNIKNDKSIGQIDVRIAEQYLKELFL